MSFAVVKFITEKGDTDEEIVSEIPLSWLTKNNTFCKWPPEKYCSLYITRSFPPEENWNEYLVVVEYICDTLAEAKQRAKCNIEVEDVGRGCRTIKPLEYFSTAEEEEKARGQRKKEGKAVTKRGHSNSTERDYYADFMTFLNRESIFEETDPVINEDSGSNLLSKQGHSSTTSTEKDDQMKKVEEKLASICNFLATLKLVLVEIKEKMETMTPQKFEIGKFLFQLPFKSLTQIDELEQYLTNEEQRKCYVQFLKSIGGNDHKDFTTRICKSLLTNTLAELCSWLGRKNNFAMDAASPPVVGIDLGTTFSCVAYYDKGKRELIPDINGDTLIMSFVYFTPENGEVYVGKHAYDMSKYCPSNGIRDAKRLIGRKFNDHFVQKYIKSKQTSSKIVKGKNEMAVFSLKICKQTILKTPEDISAEILKYLKESASSFFNTSIKEAVISIPAYFSNAQKNSTRKSAEIAGLDVLKLITEPTAAGIYYVKDKHLTQSNLMVFDWGGGTLDVSLIQIRNNVFEVKAVYGDTFLGGRNIDEALFEHFYVPVKQKTELFARRLLDECVTLKEALTVIKDTRKILEYYDGQNDMDLSMNREQFENLTDHIFQRVINIVEHALRDSGWSISDIDQLVLVGGSTRIPKIKNMLKNIFGETKIKTDLNPDTAVASGASIQAYLLKLSDTELENYKITEVTPLSLGIGMSQNLMEIFIKRNTRLPISEKIPLVTTRNNQREASFTIYEGERNNTEHNNKLGELTIDDLPPKRAGDVVFDVIFHLDRDGILTVEATENSTGKTNALTITMGEFRLSEQKIKYSKDDAAKYKIEDEVFKKFALLKQTMFEICQHILFELRKIEKISERCIVKIACERYLASTNVLNCTKIDELEKKFNDMYDQISRILKDNNMLDILDKWKNHYKD